jgi:hypothetical protein
LIGRRHVKKRRGLGAWGELDQNVQFSAALAGADQAGLVEAAMLPLMVEPFNPGMGSGRK